MKKLLLFGVCLLSLMGCSTKNSGKKYSKIESYINITFNLLDDMRMYVKSIDYVGQTVKEWKVYLYQCIPDKAYTTFYVCHKTSGGIDYILKYYVNYTGDFS